MLNSQINNNIFNNFHNNSCSSVKVASGQIKMPDSKRNYVIVDKNKIDFYVRQGEKSIPILEEKLNKTADEKEITETLYILDQMIDSGVKGVNKIYPTLSKFNESKSPNIQTFLAGIYRKTKVPDAFGPLVTMLIRNSINQPPEPQYFNPNEEIGGAILSYLA